MTNIENLVKATQEGRDLQAKEYYHMRSIDKVWARDSYMRMYRLDCRLEKERNRSRKPDLIDYLRRVKRCKKRCIL